MVAPLSQIHFSVVGLLTSHSLPYLLTFPQWLFLADSFVRYSSASVPDLHRLPLFSLVPQTTTLPQYGNKKSHTGNKNATVTEFSHTPDLSLAPFQVRPKVSHMADILAHAFRR